jgi:hypothetical protein
MLLLFILLGRVELSLFLLAGQFLDFGCSNLGTLFQSFLSLPFLFFLCFPGGNSSLLTGYLLFDAR